MYKYVLVADCPKCKYTIEWGAYGVIDPYSQTETEHFDYVGCSNNCILTEEEEKVLRTSAKKYDVEAYYKFDA